MINDVFIEEVRRPFKGTLVHFQIKCKSRKQLKSVFDEYTNQDFVFNKTQIKIRLSPKKGLYVSRSEAKRLTVGLEDFEHVVLDFAKIETIGQGFADEIFRVFQTAHPKIKIEPISMNTAVAFMVKKATKVKK